MFVGTNNSCAYTLDFNDSIFRYFNCMKENIEKKLKSQYHSLHHQMQIGARVLDIKVTKIKNTYYATNIYSCQPLSTR